MRRSAARLCYRRSKGSTRGSWPGLRLGVTSAGFLNRNGERRACQGDLMTPLIVSGDPSVGYPLHGLDGANRRPGVASTSSWIRTVRIPWHQLGCSQHPGAEDARLGEWMRRGVLAYPPSRTAASPGAAAAGLLVDARRQQPRRYRGRAAGRGRCCCRPRRSGRSRWSADRRPHHRRCSTRVHRSLESPGCTTPCRISFVLSAQGESGRLNDGLLEQAGIFVCRVPGSERRSDPPGCGR